MKIIRPDIDYPITPSVPITLTIGNFDGVHLGHHAVLNRVKSNFVNGVSAVVSFENHPSQILRPTQPTCLICHLNHKIKLIEKAGIDLLILLPFTKELSLKSSEEFLSEIRQLIPFTHLVLGHDATLGKDRHGNKTLITKFASAEGFSVEYLAPFILDGNPVSSSRIRDLIRKGEFDLVDKLLGRKYSIMGPVTTGLGRGKIIGFQTANVDVSGLCLPPLGVYAVRVIKNGETFDAVANLGIAPSVRDSPIPVLEAHLLGKQIDLYHQEVEVVFYGFIRPEKHFSNLSNLKDQIDQDIKIAKEIFLL